MGPHSIGGMNRFVVETLQIDRVRAINGDFPIIDVPRNGADQPEILIFVVTGTRSWEKNQRQPALFAENQHLKLSAQPRRIPFDMAFVHEFRASILMATR